MVRGPAGVLRQRELFEDLVDDPRFVAAYTTALTTLHTTGARAVLGDLAMRSAQAAEREPTTIQTGDDGVIAPGTSRGTGSGLNALRVA